EHLAARPKMLFRIAMAIEAPFHEQRIDLIKKRHLIDPAMACYAADALVNVDAVIKVRKARQVVDALPGDRLARAITFPHRCEYVAAGPDFLVAIHARLGRRNPRKGGFLHGRMAIPAINAKLANVVLMTERDGLDVSRVRACGIGGSKKDRQKPAE